MKILLACSAGTSTAILEESINEYLKENKIKGTAVAHGADMALEILNDFDVVLLGPQVSHRINEFLNISTTKKVDCISRKDFAFCIGENVVKQAQKLLKSKSK